MPNLNPIFKLFPTLTFFLLFHTVTSQTPACPSFCRFRLCFRLGSTVFVTRENPNLLLRPASIPQGVFLCEVRRSGVVRRALRNVIVREASVSPGRSARPFVPISDFRDAWPRFRPDFFTVGPLGADGLASIVKGRPVGNQADVFKGLCVRLPVASHQLLRRNGMVRRTITPRGRTACIGFRTRFLQLDVELLWNTQNNFNVRLIEPSPGTEINIATPTSTAGGRLSGDAGANGCIAFFPAERIRYLASASVLPGTYTVMVDHVNQCSPSSEVTLRVSFQGAVLLQMTETVIRTGDAVIFRTFSIP